MPITLAEHLLFLDPNRSDYCRNLFEMVSVASSKHGNKLGPVVTVEILKREELFIRCVRLADEKRIAIMMLLQLIMQVRTFAEVISRVNTFQEIRQSQKDLDSMAGGDAAGWKRFIFPQFDYEHCSEGEVKQVGEFLGHALAVAAAHNTKDNSGIKGLNLQEFVYNKLPPRLKALVNERDYSQQLVAIEKQNERVRKMAKKSSTPLKIYNKVKKFDWEITGFINVFGVVEAFLKKCGVGGDEKVKKKISEVISEAIFDAGIVFIRDDQLELFLHCLSGRVDLKQADLANQVKSAINDFFKGFASKSSNPLADSSQPSMKRSTSTPGLAQLLSPRATPLSPPALRTALNLRGDSQAASPSTYKSSLFYTPRGGEASAVPSSVSEEKPKQSSALIAELELSLKAREDLRQRRLSQPLTPRAKLSPNSDAIAHESNVAASVAESSASLVCSRM